VRPSKTPIIYLVWHFSLDCTLLASASRDGIKLWAFQSRQLLASFGVHYRVCDLIFSPDSQRLAYSEFGQSTKCGQPQIHICGIPSNILARISPEQEAVNVCICPRTSTSLVLPCSYYRPLNLNVHSSLMHSTYEVLFVHSSLPFILPMISV
jgi:hypothetical protein